MNAVGKAPVVADEGRMMLLARDIGATTTRLALVCSVAHLASRLRPGSATLIRFAPVLSLIVCLIGTGLATAAAGTETFGPGQVSCQTLGGEQVDCLLSASRITEGNGNEVSFSLIALPPGERALFRKWCLNPADECTVTIQGQKESPQATRLAMVTSLQWKRPRAPRDQAAAAP